MTIIDPGALRGASCTQTIQRAIDEAAASGGGCVVIPAGEYETAGLVLRSHVELRLTGPGTLEGQGRRWWDAFRAGGMRAARPCFVCFEDCERVVMSDFTVQNSPAWTIHPLRCENVSIRGLTVVNPSDSPNTDGIDPESCRNVRISDCHIDVGDDCVAVKAGTEVADVRVPF